MKIKRKLSEQEEKEFKHLTEEYRAKVSKFMDITVRQQSAEDRKKYKAEEKQAWTALNDFVKQVNKGSN